MPTKKALKETRVDVGYLARKAYGPREAEALKRYDAIKARGGDPEIRLSDHNGYRVFDPTEEAVRQAKLRCEFSRSR
jgi:hypothetical protein